VHSLDRRGVEGDARRAQAPVEEQLDHQPTEGVPDEDRLRPEIVDLRM
jgi:hypothetical protein